MFNPFRRIKHPLELILGYDELTADKEDVIPVDTELTSLDRSEPDDSLLHDTTSSERKTPPYC